ncbi:hypothetical protein BC830DRAFT_1152117, partial [Chytriomyces sp. MP71]
ITIQSAVRGYLCRKKYVHQVQTLSAAIKIQRLWRGFSVRKSFAQQRNRIILLQSCVRKTQAKKALKTLRLQAKDVEKVKER